MANYVAHYTKKLQARKRREDALIRLIASGTGSDEQLLRAARLVHDSRIRALKALRATLPPDGRISEKFVAVDAKIREAETLTETRILAEFGQLVSDSREQRTS